MKGQILGVFLLYAVLHICTVLGAASSEPIELTDVSFESLTHASTDTSTGTWFVMFYAPWCGHCRALEPKWTELAEELKGQVNVAKLDATANPATSSRFDIRGYPTLLLFSKGYYYRYSDARDVGAMSEFALYGYKKVGAKAVPKLPSSSIPLVAQLKPFVDLFKIAPAAVISIVCATLLTGIIIGRLTYSIVGGTAPTPAATQKKDQ